MICYPGWKMDDLESQQLDLLDGAKADRIQKRQSGVIPILTPHISSQYGARKAIDGGVGAALIFAVGYGFSLIAELAHTKPLYEDHPIFSNNTHLLAIADGTMLAAALGLAASIWYLEADWTTWALLFWSLFEISYVGPRWILDHVYPGRLFYFPYLAFVVALNAWLGSRALHTKLPKFSGISDT